MRDLLLAFFLWFTIECNEPWMTLRWPRWKRSLCFNKLTCWLVYGPLYKWLMKKLK